MKTLTPELLHRDTADVGEGPLWDPRVQRLYWVDIPRQKLFRFDPLTGSNEAFTLPDIVTSVHQRAKGGLLLTLRKNVVFYDPDTGNLERVASIEPDLPKHRFNDAACDPRGNLWVGTMHTELWNQPEGALYRVDQTLTPMLQAKGISCSNGTGWSPDGRTMYHTDSFHYGVFAYDFDPETASISNRRTFASVDPKSGMFPDGLTVDAEGGVWSAHMGVGKIVRYDPEGKVEREIQLPVSRGTSCVFGGANLDVLYITTAQNTLTPAQLEKEPLAGSLFACDTGCRGRAATPFCG